MAKVIFEFDLYEDREDIEMFHKCKDYYCALDDIREMIRKHTKYGEEGDSVTWDKLSDLFYEIIRDRNIEL
jgi:hypothetical protein